MNFLQKLKDNIDMKTVVSSVVASIVVGSLAYMAVRSGIKPLAAAAKIVK